MRLENLISNQWIMSFLNYPKKILFENGSVKQTVFKNITWLSASEIITRFLTAFSTIFIARILGAENFGFFTFAVSFTGIFSVFAEFGLRQIVIREINQREEVQKELGTILWLRILLGVAALFLIVFSSFFVKQEAARIITMIFGVIVLIGNVYSFFITFFQAIQRMEYIAFAEIIKAVFIVGGSFLILFMRPDIIFIAYVYLLGAILGLISIFFVSRKFRFLLNPVFNKELARKYLIMSLPIVLSSAFSVIYVELDSIMMGFWNMIREVGLYQAAYKIVNITVVPSIVIGNVFYPIVANAYKKESFRNILNIFFLSLLFFALPIVVGGFLLTKEIILFLYGSEYLRSILAFKILIFMSGLITLITFSQYLFVVTNHQKKFSWLTGLTALFNIILNFILIPKYSLYGAAVATIISYIFLFLFSFIILKKINILPEFKVILSPFLAVLVMAIFIYSGLLQNLIIPRILAAGLIYCLAFFFLIRKQAFSLGINQI